MKEREQSLSPVPDKRFSPQMIEGMMATVLKNFSDLSAPFRVNEKTASLLGISRFGLRRWVLMTAGEGVLPEGVIRRKTSSFRLGISVGDLLSVLASIKDFYALRRNIEEAYSQARKTLFESLPVETVLKKRALRQTSERRISRKGLLGGDYLSLAKLVKGEIECPRWKMNLLYLYLQKQGQPVEAITTFRDRGVVTYFGVPHLFPLPQARIIYDFLISQKDYKI